MEIIVIEKNQPSEKALREFNQYVFEVIQEYCEKNNINWDEVE